MRLRRKFCVDDTHLVHAIYLPVDLIDRLRWAILPRRSMRRLLKGPR